jgi:hypothetical protein
MTNQEIDAFVEWLHVCVCHGRLVRGFVCEFADFFVEDYNWCEMLGRKVEFPSLFSIGRHLWKFHRRFTSNLMRKVSEECHDDYRNSTMKPAPHEYAWLKYNESVRGAATGEPVMIANALNVACHLCCELSSGQVDVWHPVHTDADAHGSNCVRHIRVCSDCLKNIGKIVVN